jgi:hypothetical protein
MSSDHNLIYCNLHLNQPRLDYHSLEPSVCSSLGERSRR